MSENQIHVIETGSRLDEGVEQNVEVVRGRGKFRLLASRDLVPGELVFVLRGEVFSAPTRWSIQIGIDQHLDAPVDTSLEERLDRHVFSFLNHSCDPNARFVGRALVARTPIRRFEEITFDYSTNEYEMAEPFACGCGAEQCRGLIAGFARLSEEQQQGLRGQAAPHVLLAARRATS